MDASQYDLETIRQMLAELATRVYRIERRLQMDAQPPPELSGEPKAVPPPSPAPAAPAGARMEPVPAQISFSRSAASPVLDRDLESRIGSHWLNRIGIAALLIGISYFLKFAFENNWVGPAGRVTIGLIAGLAVVLWSERFRSHGYRAFSYSLKAVGIGALYLSLWAAFQRYSLIPNSVAFVMMLAVTASAAAMALAQDAQILAAFALTGGFATPLLLSTGQNREIALFCYVAILDLATLVLAAFKPWRRLLVISYTGTLVLYIGWYSEFYGRSQLGITLAFATVFFAIFAIAPLVTRQPAQAMAIFVSFPAILAFVNACVYFLQAYVMIREVDKTYMAWFALALAAIYILLSRLDHARNWSAQSAQILHLQHLAVAIGLITIAIPLRLNSHWITLGWLVEAGVLLWLGNRSQSDFLNVFALAALLLGVFRVLLIDNFHTTQLLFNLRMAIHLVAIAVLGTVARYAAQRTDNPARQVGAIALAALNVLALIALSREVADFYARQIATVHLPMRQWGSFDVSVHRVETERDFTYSALWMAYGALLMTVGFLRRSPFIRWQALILIALTIVKVFVYDVQQLDKGYRIVSFIILGGLLLAISFLYQRDWLKLSAKHRYGDEKLSTPD
jgi:uncharacterized membrane protein